MGRYLISIAVVLITSPLVSASLLNPTAQSRFVRNGATQIDASDFGPFADSVTAASQSSDILAEGLVATGSVFTDDNNRDTESKVDVTFDLTADVTYTITGFIRGTFSTANAISAFTLSRLSPNPAVIHDIMVSDSGPPGWNVNLNYAGMLPAGEYELIVYTKGTNGDPVGGVSSGSYEVDLTVVPEPATIGLVALIGLIITRRRRSVLN